MNHNLLPVFPRQLEDEGIYIMREVAAQFERPVLLFSGGKDSITLVRLAQKAFWPGKIPFPLLHIDTARLPAGMYVLSITIGEGAPQSFKVLSR